MIVTQLSTWQVPGVSTAESSTTCSTPDARAGTAVSIALTATPAAEAAARRRITLGLPG